MKKFADESTSERDSSNAEFPAMTYCQGRDVWGEDAEAALTIIFEKYRNPNGSLDALEFNHAVFFVTFVNYVQKTTSSICLDFKTVTKLSKIVCLDSEICFESALNGSIKCLGVCETRKQVSFHTVSGVIVKHLCLLNFDFGCGTVLMMSILDGITQDFSLTGCFPGCVAEPNSSSVLKNLRVRRLHLRAYH